jgi:CubicO group peptidase (beta-lactamase class C family)
VAQIKLGFDPTLLAEANPLAAEILNISNFFDGNTTSWRRLSAVMPSVNGYCNGRSIAWICAIFALRGKLGWRRYLSKRIVAEAATEQVHGDDLYIGRIKWGLGLGLSSEGFPGPSPTAFHWGGLGGSWGVMDPKARVSLGYTPNHYLAGSGAAWDPRLARFNTELTKLLPSLS